MLMHKILRFFRVTGALEAFSYLVLLLIAMPLKYVWHLPIYVRWVGSFHGAFFVLFSIAVALAAYQKKWSIKVTLLAFFSSFVPLGPFIFEHYYLPKTDDIAVQEDS